MTSNVFYIRNGDKCPFQFLFVYNEMYSISENVFFLDNHKI